MSMKLLSPAGDMESLKAAIYNGADEVYLGISGFNARNNISGFTLETLKPAVNFAHIYGVRVHLAINILFSDEELQDAINTIISAYNLGVDAFIIQDLGLAQLLHNHFPEIELHASTQMGICNLEGARYISQFGFKRIVLARETSLEEIKRIKDNLDIELEYFAQGALCISFSGNCYISSYLCNASGNRGKCKQLCRLPYTLLHNNKKLKEGFLLSARDFNMLPRLKDLEFAGIDAIKIEGRARRPYYVAVATKTYRDALDKKPFNAKELELAFTRQYTQGYFNGNGNIISPYNNHIGIQIGKIEKVNRGKKFNEVIFSSNIKLNPKSTFKVFCTDKEVCTFTAYSLKEIKKSLYSTTTTQNVPQNGILHLIVDEMQEQKTLDLTKKVSVNINIQAHLDKPILAKICLNGKAISVLGDICDKAKNQPLTIQDFEECFNKSEYFSPKLNMELENVFLTKKQLNEFRRKCYTELISKLTNNNRKQLENFKIGIAKSCNPLKNFAVVDSYKVLPNTSAVIYSPETYTLSDIELFKNKCIDQNRLPILDTPPFLTKADIEMLNTIINKTKIKIVANNYGCLSLSEDIVAGAGLNIYNNFSAAIINKPYLTAESDFGSKIQFPYMTLVHCPMKSHLNATCNTCPYKEGYRYKMESGQILNLNRKKLKNCTFYLTTN